MRPILTSLVFTLSCLSTSSYAFEDIAHAPPSASAIELHLHAIQNKDADMIYSYASEDAKAQYTTPEAYLRMIRHSYKPLYDHKSYKVMSSWGVNGLRTHKIEFTLYDGTVHTALIRFKQHDDQHWSLINIFVLGDEAQPI